jgi:hypothetical protein
MQEKYSDNYYLERKSINIPHSENFFIVSGLDQLVFHGVWRSKKAKYGDSNHNWDKNGIWLIV